MRYMLLELIVQMFCGTYKMYLHFSLLC